MGLLKSILRTGYKVGKTAADVAEEVVYKSQDYGARYTEKKMGNLAKKYGRVLTDDQKDVFLQKFEGVQETKGRVFDHYYSKAFNMSSKSLVKALNHSSGIEYEAYAAVAKERDDIKYKHKKGKWKLISD